MLCLARLAARPQRRECLLHGVFVTAGTPGLSAPSGARTGQPPLQIMQIAEDFAGTGVKGCLLQAKRGACGANIHRLCGCALAAPHPRSPPCLCRRHCSKRCRLLARIGRRARGIAPELNAKRHRVQDGCLAALGGRRPGDCRRRFEAAVAAFEPVHGAAAASATRSGRFTFSANQPTEVSTPARTHAQAEQLQDIMATQNPARIMGPRAASVSTSRVEESAPLRTASLPRAHDNAAPKHAKPPLLEAPGKRTSAARAFVTYAQ